MCVRMRWRQSNNKIHIPRTFILWDVWPSSKRYRAKAMASKLNRRLFLLPHLFSGSFFFLFSSSFFFFFLLSRGSWHAYTRVRCIVWFSLFALPIFTIYVYIRTLFFFSLISHFIYCAVCCNDCVAVIWMMEQWCHQPYYYDWLKLSWMCAERKEHVPT